MMKQRLCAILNILLKLNARVPWSWSWYYSQIIDEETEAEMD